jgi:thiol-disulfide isomerase/thioredoxin
MKKIIGITIIGLLLLFAGIVGFKVHNKLRTKAAIESNIAQLPSFEFTMLNGQLLNSSDIKANKVIVNYFNPECEHCQYMAQTYSDHAGELNKLQILMVTIADSATTKLFAQTYKLDSIPAITILLDNKRTFASTFGTTMLPSFFIYKNGQLISKYFGETKMETLLKD